MEHDELERAVETARLAALAAGKVALGYFNTGVAVETKPDRSPVTAADRASEAAILALIRERHPGHSILTEETGAHPGSPDHRWIVDPLDGTRGFTRGGPYWGPLVGYERNGEIVAGAMSMPVIGETYWAGRGLGCFLNGKQVQVSRVRAWPDATLSLGELHKLLGSRWSAAVSALATGSASARCYGDLASCAQVITGKAEAWLEAGVQIWDLSPHKILIEEAGGRFTDLEGKSTIASGHALATNGLLHDELLRALRAGSAQVPNQ
jgi:histidinol-phosphatase